ncbi:MAG TPA: class IV adenylate cyclase [Bryobacteraceae bacterium]|jgi:adenylate cyclase class 2|nr:class IV adenylate cyclase [Bryobacteraceae bacterium]
MNPIETEVKIPLADLGNMKKKLADAGFAVSVAREHEVNDIYDTPSQSLRQNGMLLRLRQVGKRSILTFKGPGQPGPHKSRAELETNVGSLDTMQQIFEQLDYRPVFRYEKYRTEFIDSGQRGTVTLDETPIGNFLEIEGPGDWIDQTAARLGFTAKDYLLDSYGKLYLDYCTRLGIKPSNMVFPTTHEERPVT